MEPGTVRTWRPASGHPVRCPNDLDRTPIRERHAHDADSEGR